MRAPHSIDRVGPAEPRDQLDAIAMARSGDLRLQFGVVRLVGRSSDQAKPQLGDLVRGVAKGGDRHMLEFQAVERPHDRHGEREAGSDTRPVGGPNAFNVQAIADDRDLLGGAAGLNLREMCDLSRHGDHGIRLGQVKREPFPRAIVHPEVTIVHRVHDADRLPARHVDGEQAVMVIDQIHRFAAQKGRKSGLIAAKRQGLYAAV